MDGRLKGEKMCTEEWFPSGYLIALGKQQYFWKWEERTILSTGRPEKARSFPTVKEAEAFVREQLAFIGLDPCICMAGWAIVSWEVSPSGEEVERYWQGECYGEEEHLAVRFSSYQEAAAYQREKKLQESGGAEFHLFREKQILLAA